MRLAHLLAVVAALASLPGCGADPPRQVVDTSNANLLALYSAYVEVAAAGSAPKKVEDLKRALPEYSDDHIHKLMVSPNDAKPYVIRWGLAPGASALVLAHEDEGKDGKRYVLMTNGECPRLNQEEFELALKKSR